MSITIEALSTKIRRDPCCWGFFSESFLRGNATPNTFY